MTDSENNSIPPTEASVAKRTGIFLQDACFQHRYIRSKLTSDIVERPERLRAVMVGLSAAIARIEEALPATAPVGIAANATSETSALTKAANTSGDGETEELEVAMGRMTLAQKQHLEQPLATLNLNAQLGLSIVHSQASVDLLNNAAVKFVHGDVDGDVYLEKLVRWAEESGDKIAKGESEIPEGLSQGDLYLCPQSLNAIQGALGTVCEAVDCVMASAAAGEVKAENEGSQADSDKKRLAPVQRAFVAIRPPGHHCGEDTPSGFCFVNNVAVAAAHAHLRHGIQRVVIFDIDLHHGNGTQSIAWQINEESYRQILEKEAGSPDAKTGPQVFYGSIHDVLSYPCEDGKVELVQAASVSIHKAHGQYIENIHLEPYTSEQQFRDVLYKKKYSRLLKKAEEFLTDTGGPGDDVLIFISCGMDACEHEYESMSRHGRKVPVSFYHQFTRDACCFSDRFARGRLVSVLEGGYSDRALISGTMAHISGLITAHRDTLDEKVDREWWDVENLTKLEKATKQCKGLGGRKSLQSNAAEAAYKDKWLERTTAILSFVDNGMGMSKSPAGRRSSAPLLPSSMTLRDRSRKEKANGVAGQLPSSPSRTNRRGRQSTGGQAKEKEDMKQRASRIPASTSSASVSSRSNSEKREDKNGRGKSDERDRQAQAEQGTKKLPRVILRLGPSS
ncbi:hypothetical protein AX17_006670 [Amanita inopinata Kibby_2008]|nr:hypothetical protein AX17_006670 [Amanita inopinata Kibby_2008]